MISFKDGNNRFNYRVVGVAIKDNKVLFHKADGDKFWALPGGRGEMFEPSTETIAREMIEELGQEVEVQRLLWVVENFFEYQQIKNHELSFYYLINFKFGSNIYNSEEIIGIEEQKKLKFKWIEISSIDNENIQPSFLKKAIKNISNEIIHIVQQDI